MPEVDKKEGARAAINSMSEELFNKLVGLNLGLSNLDAMLPEEFPSDHPLRLQIARLLEAGRNGLSVVQKYNRASITEDFDFSPDVVGVEVLDIHPNAINPHIPKDV